LEKNFFLEKNSRGKLEKMKRNFPSLPANSHRGEGVRERENGGGACLLTYS